MVHIRDEGSVFDVPIDRVWEYVASGDRHSRAHAHQGFRRQQLSDRSGEYSWEQPFDGRLQRFTMRWTSYRPLGVAYDVTEGPFAGSTFFLYYGSMGDRTAVTMVGEFVSPTMAESQIPAAVDRFFTTEFEQDLAALRQDRDAAPASRGTPA